METTKKSGTKSSTVGKMGSQSKTDYASKLGLGPNSGESEELSVYTIPNDTSIKIKQNLINGSRGVSVNIIMFAYTILSSQLDNIKRTNIWSTSLYNTTDSKAVLKDKIYKWYLNYTTPDFECTWLKGITYNKGHFNLREVIDTYEKYLEESLFRLGAIDKDNNVIDSSLYNDIYQKCRLYLHEEVIAEQFKNDELELFKNDGKAYKSKNSRFIDENRELHSKFDNDVKVHKRLTTDKIQNIYEESLGINFVESIFEIHV